LTDRQDWRPKPGPLAEAGQYMGHGLSLALATLLFLFLGWRLDGWLGTTPLFTILGAFVGAGAGFYNLYYQMIVKPRERESDQQHGQEPDEPED
jgi:F0F1-type ATP synthase assembly protein I